MRRRAQCDKWFRHCFSLFVNIPILWPRPGAPLPAFRKPGRYVMRSDNFSGRYDVAHPLEASEAVGEWAKVEGTPSVEALDKEGFKAHRPVGRIW